MLKSILTLLDDTTSGAAAASLSLEMAQHAEASITGLSILNLETVDQGFGMLVRTPQYSGRRDDPKIEKAWKRLRAVREDFESRCKKGGVACETIEHEGHAYRFLQFESPAHDVIAIGKEMNFEMKPRSDMQETIGLLLRASSRPLVITPKETGFQPKEDVLVAYDGSMPAATTLQLFVQLGLARGSHVHVVTAGEDVEHTAAVIGKARQYLEAHGVDVTCHEEKAGRHPTDVIEDKVDEIKPGFVVMGAYGRRGWREYVLGSSTSGLIKFTPVPIFIHH